MFLCFAASLAVRSCSSSRRLGCASNTIRASLPQQPSQSPHRGDEPKEFVFDAPLLRGVIVGRPNRFIFRAVIPSVDKVSEVEAHSPAVGKITGGGGFLEFASGAPVRALLSEAKGPTAKLRRTRYTVEAVDIGAGADGDAALYCGINQTKSNDYLSFFLANGCLEEILPPGCEIRREVLAPDGKSRIDIVATTPDEKEIWVRLIIQKTT